VSWRVYWTGRFQGRICRVRVDVVIIMYALWLVGLEMAHRGRGLPIRRVVNQPIRISQQDHILIGIMDIQHQRAILRASRAVNCTR